jgi:peptidoglycan/xylan/chitin deacetylase (PgdA/CDA1 family)
MRIFGVPVGFLATLALRLTGARAGVALMYHRVGDPPGDPTCELNPLLGSRLLASQLRYVRACFRVVPASELMEAAASRRRGRRFPLALTFDDDLASHVTEAAPLLRRSGLTATFFLTGASLSKPFTFWWERLQLAVDRGLTPAKQGIHALAGEVQVMEPAARDEYAERLAGLVGTDDQDPGLPAAHVRALVDAGFEIGFHTRRHDFLPILDDDALAAALRDGRTELEELAGRPLEGLAYPHGGADARVAAAARAAGYRYGFTCDREAVGAGTDPLLIGRLDEVFDSTGRFALRLVKTLWQGARAQSRRT